MDWIRLGSQYESKNAFAEDFRKRVISTEVKYHGCAEVIIRTFLDILEENNSAVAMASSPFAAGLALTGNNCGAVIGGLMVLGMVFGRKDITEGLGGILRGIKPMRKLVKYFDEKYGLINCRDITQTDLANPEKAKAYFDAGGLQRCAKIMGDVAAFVGGLIYEEKVEKVERN